MSGKSFPLPLLLTGTSKNNGEINAGLVELRRYNYPIYNQIYKLSRVLLVF